MVNSMSYGMLMLLTIGMLTVSPSVTAQWSSAHATYYGGADASGTNGQYGYGDQLGLYGTITTAVSSPLFDDGAACGACYEVQCVDSEFCYNGKTAKVTATNLCPGGNDGSWCDTSRYHFDLSQPAFNEIGQQIAGHFPIQYRRISCNRSGGVQFVITGSPNWNLVLIENVAGAGDVREVFVKAAGDDGWTTMSRNWGDNWQCYNELVGRSLSFKVTLSDGSSMVFDEVVPSDWSFGH